jgi:methyl-accepting chemotaxis protein
MIRKFLARYWVTPEQLAHHHNSIATQIRKATTTIERLIMATQEDVQALADQLSAVSEQISAGVQELDDEIARLGTANPALDLAPLSDKLAGLQAVADQLANDNVPAAPVVEPPV